MMHFRKSNKHRLDEEQRLNEVANAGTPSADLNDMSSHDPVNPAPLDSSLELDLSPFELPATSSERDSADDGENLSLSAEEAEEIRLAFQQVLALGEPELPATLSIDEALTLTLADPIVDPLDLRDCDQSIDLLDNHHLPEASIADTEPDTEIESELLANASEAESEALVSASEPLASESEPLCVGFQASAAAVEQIALAVDELDLIEAPTLPLNVAEIVEQHLATESEPIQLDLLEPDLMVAEAEIVDENPLTLIVDENPLTLIVDENPLALATDSAIDSVSLVAMGLDTEAPDDQLASDAPLTYFQYYLEDENADGEEHKPNYDRSTWQQPSVPAGLIGAGVLGATLISGFMIMDSLKQLNHTQAKKPNSPSPLQSLNPQGQATAFANPKPTAPESTLKPEVPLPPAPTAKTDSLTTAVMPNVFPPLPPLAPTTSAEPVVVARTLDVKDMTPPAQPVIAAQPERKVMTAAVAAPETLPVPPTPVVTPVPAPEPIVVQSGVQSGVQSTAPVFTPVEPPATVNPRMAAPVRAQLPQLEPGMEGKAADLQTVARSTSPAPEAADQSGFVPVETSAPATALPPDAAPVSSAPNELIYQQEPAAKVATPTPAGSPVAAPTLPASVDPSLQSLLMAPSPGFDATAASLRSLTQAEANAVAQSSQLGSFSRQSLGAKEYVQAYRSVSQQLNALPPFGFIDYQRQMILLPADNTALNQVDGQLTKPQMAQAEPLTLAN